MSANSAGSPDGKENSWVTCTPDHPLRVVAADLGRDQRAGVVAVRAVALVAQPGHQLEPGSRDPLRVPAGAGRRAGERDAGYRRDDDVEGVRWIAAVGARVAQRPDQVEVLEDRHRPAVRADQRQRVGLGRAHVEEVHRLAVDRRRELRVGVEPGLLVAPVEGRAPVVDELAHVLERDAVVPVGAGQLIGPAHPGQACLEVVEVGLRQLGPERSSSEPSVGMLTSLLSVARAARVRRARRYSFRS